MSRITFTCWVHYGEIHTKLTFNNVTDYDDLIPTIKQSTQLSVPPQPIKLYDSDPTNNNIQPLSPRATLSTPPPQDIYVALIIVDAKQLYKWIMDYVQTNRSDKDNKYLIPPANYISDDDRKFSFLGRDVALAIFFAYTLKSFNRRNIENKFDHPFFVVSGAPGIGKSRFLLECGSIFENPNDSLNKFKSPMTDTLLSNDIPKEIPIDFPKKIVNLQISFGNGSEFNSSKETDPHQTIISRVLYRYFVSGSCPTITFDQFRIDLKSCFGNNLALDLPFKCIHQHLGIENRIMINLGIDEYQRCIDERQTHPKNRRVFLKNITLGLGGLLISFKGDIFLNIICAGTPTVQLREVITQDSNHASHLIPLKPLEKSEYLSFIRTYLNEPELSPSLLTTLYSLGGWPRKLSFSYPSLQANPPYYKVLIAKCLTKTKIELKTEITAGITYEDIERNGEARFLFENNLYYIDLPLLFIKKYLIDSDDEHFNSVLKFIEYLEETHTQINWINWENPIGNNTLLPIFLDTNAICIFDGTSNPNQNVVINGDGALFDWFSYHNGFYLLGQGKHTTKDDKIIEQEELKEEYDKVFKHFKDCGTPKNRNYILAVVSNREFSSDAVKFALDHEYIIVIDLDSYFPSTLRGILNLPEKSPVRKLESNSEFHIITRSKKSKMDSED
eukprot:gene4575-5709_t